MKRIARFQRNGGGVYTCAVCGRNTRRVDSDHASSCCSECFELAGYDNMFNDNGRRPNPREIAECERLLAIIAKRGGDVTAVRNCNSYIWE